MVVFAEIRRREAERLAEERLRLAIAPHLHEQIASFGEGIGGSLDERRGQSPLDLQRGDEERIGFVEASLKAARPSEVHRRVGEFEMGRGRSRAVVSKNLRRKPLGLSQPTGLPPCVLRSKQSSPLNQRAAQRRRRLFEPAQAEIGLADHRVELRLQGRLRDKGVLDLRGASIQELPHGHLGRGCRLGLTCSTMPIRKRVTASACACAARAASRSRVAKRACHSATANPATSATSARSAMLLPLGEAGRTCRSERPTVAVGVQGPPLDVLHHEVGAPFFALAGVVELGYPRMLKPRQNLLPVGEASLQLRGVESVGAHLLVETAVRAAR